MHIDVIQSSAGASFQPAKQIKAGDVVHGKVMASADGKAAIKLQDGSSFSATLAEGVSLKEGQQVKLVVTGQQDGKMTMQIAPEGEGAARLAESTLSGMNLPTGGRNVELATAFLRQGVSLSPELMQRASDIMAKNPGLDPDTAAFMANNNMDANLAQAVQDLASRQNGIASQLATLEQVLIDSGGTQPGSEATQANPAATGEGAATVATDAPPTAEGQPPAQPGGMSNTADVTSTTQPQPGAAQGDAATQAAQPSTQQTQQSNVPGQQSQANAIDNSAPQANNANAAANGNTANVNASGGDTANSSAVNSSTAGDTTAGNTINNGMDQSMTQVQDTAQASTNQSATAAEAPSGNQATPSAAGNQPANAAPAAKAQQAAQPAADFRPGPETVKALTIFIGRDNPGAVAALKMDGLASAAEAMSKAAALPAEQGEAALQGFLDSQPQLSPTDGTRLLAQLRNGAQALRESVQPHQEGVGALLGKLGDMFAKLDKDAAKGIELKQANRLPDKLEDMQEAIAKTTVAGKEAMTSTVQRALGQSKAMEQINQFVYTQLPVELNGQKDMAELYVFKRPGKQKKIDPEQVTMVIALDTQNIGRVESLIKVDGKNVFLRFRVDGDGIADALRSGTIEAGEALADIGYNLLELRCELNEEDINILNAATTVQAEFLDVRNLDFFI